MSIWHSGEDRPHRDAKLAEPAVAGRRQFEPPSRLLQQVGSGKRAQRQIEIFGMARHRADHGYVGRRHDAGRRMAARRDQPPGRFVAIDAAVMRRVAQRAGDVAAGAEGRQPRGKRRRFAARRATGRARQVPRVVGGAVNVIVALRVGEHVRHVGLAEHDGAGMQQAIDQERVAGGDVVLPQRIAEGGRQAGDIERFLDRHRNAVQRSPALAAGEGGIGGKFHSARAMRFFEPGNAGKILIIGACRGHRSRYRSGQATTQACRNISIQGLAVALP